MNKLLILILLCSFFACQKKEPVFTLVECEKGTQTDIRKPKDEFYYSYFILIENTMNDKMMLKRLLIHNFFNLTSPMDSMRTYSDLYFVSCMFLKSTLKTKQRFRIEPLSLGSGNVHCAGDDTYTDPYGRNADSWYNNKTYVGSILISRCKEDKMKLKTTMTVNLGTTNAIRWSECRGPDGAGKEEDILLDECEPDWHVYNKDSELVKLFNEYYKKI